MLLILNFEYNEKAEELLHRFSNVLFLQITFPSKILYL